MEIILILRIKCITKPLYMRKNDGIIFQITEIFSDFVPKNPDFLKRTFYCTLKDNFSKNDHFCSVFSIFLIFFTNSGFGKFWPQFFQKSLFFVTKCTILKNVFVEFTCAPLLHSDISTFHTFSIIPNLDLEFELYVENFKMMLSKNGNCIKFKVIVISLE